MVSIADRGYTTILGHLSRPETTLPLSTIQDSLAYYLAHLSPSPTPFAATIISSPLFHPLSYRKLQALNAAFRHATRLRYNAERSDQWRVFSHGLKTRLEQWVSAVLGGIYGGAAIMRLVCCGGILMGINDLSQLLIFEDRSVKGTVEDDIVVALAQVMDTYGHQQPLGAWEDDFRPMATTSEDPLILSMILASQPLSVVPLDKLRTLPLRTFIRLLMSTIDSAFHSGTFFTSLASSLLPGAPYKIKFSLISPFAQEIHSIASSLLLSYIGPLSKLCARALSLLLDFMPDCGMTTFQETLLTMSSLTAKVESDWAASPLSSVTTENDIAPDSRELNKIIWTILKALFFSMIMIQEASFSTLVFLPARSKRPSFLLHTAQFSQSATSSTLARTTLHIFSHVAFVIAQFGGVAITSGFPELKRTFYLAVDVLAADSAASETFLRELYCSFEGRGEVDPHFRRQLDQPWYQTKKAYALACIEQLVPVSSEECIEFCILPLCLPHLSDAIHRETLESSHSVMLAILAARSQRIEENYFTPNAKSELFYRKLVSFYTTSLIENSADGKLSMPQLQLAFSTLVRCASSCADWDDARPCADDGHTLTWFCIDSLLDAIRSLSGRRECAEQLHRLRLAIISTVSSLPLTLLSPVLSQICDMIHHVNDDSGSHAERWQELIEALFGEISKKVSSKEKEFAMRWWFNNQKKLLLITEGNVELSNC